MATFQARRIRQKYAKLFGCKDAPRYPHKGPIFGLDLFFDNQEHAKTFTLLETWTTRFEKYGHTFRANFLGSSAICTIDPVNIQVVHGSNFKDYGVQPLRRAATLPFLGEGVFTMDGAFWEYSRNLIRPTFNKTNVTNLSAFEVNLKKFFDLLPRDGSTVDLKPFVCRLFIDTSTEFLFGESMNILAIKSPARSQEFLDAFHYGLRGTGARLQLGKLDFLYRDKKWRDSIKVAHAFAHHYVDKAIQYRNNRLAEDNSLSSKSYKTDDARHKYVLLHEMALETGKRDVLRNQIMHVFLAGHESSAVAIGNAIFQLCRNPDMWNKLKSEVLDREKEPLTPDALKNMRYLQNIIKETLRLYPVASTATRIAYRDTILPTGGGADRNSPVFVPKGSTVMTPVYAIHRLADCFQPNPNAFQPERWEELKPGSSYILFGWGPRTCPAQNMAEMEVAYTLARTAQEWENIECRDEVKEWVEELRLSTSSRNGTKVGLVWASPQEQN
ncbi:n-alkane-inducible cytochrome P450 [Mollisia scopiformis]|uniref:N-alkane-inducible cytochrome P450 n=1 Tax=Mollisia scopiformis TaxID=149040 RepID=A0A194X9Q3_MOLSC|nr:n-alkane-inducible cytochrome P450 [Mollisia scopiformis]KUJ16502.1 n-alkane-inducible cytochrome P450 [Mollisia scopiformis]